jgi:hypothetical protein
VSPDPENNEDSEHHRKRDRAVVDKDVEIKVGARAWHRASLRDLTPDGFRLRLTDMPPVGTRLMIRMPGISMLEAEVCWSRDFEAGCKFTAPLSPYVFDHLVK